MTVNDLPAFNAALNGLATILITIGFIFIKRGSILAHRKTMISACVVSAIFLVTYVLHKVLVRGVHTPFGGEGLIRQIYFVMLITHIFLAIAIAYLVPRTFYLAITGNYEKHKRWAKFTFPIWYYVSVTGVLIYFFLYKWWPSTPVA